MTTIERRIFRGEFRDVPGSNGRQKWATAVAYNVTDDYGTTWLPGVFDEALSERMPTVLYGHDWGTLDHVLGSGIDFRQTPSDVGPPGVDVLIEFADVPAADLAMRLLSPKATSRGPVLRDVSVGFERREWVRRDKLTAEQLADGAEEAMVRAGMDELSLVVRGAVPGAQVQPRSLYEAVARLRDAPDGPEGRRALRDALDLVTGPYAALAPQARAALDAAERAPAYSDEPPAPRRRRPEPEFELIQRTHWDGLKFVRVVCRGKRIG